MKFYTQKFSAALGTAMKLYQGYTKRLSAASSKASCVGKGHEVRVTQKALSCIEQNCDYLQRLPAVLGKVMKVFAKAPNC